MFPNTDPKSAVHYRLNWSAIMLHLHWNHELWINRQAVQTDGNYLNRASSVFPLHSWATNLATEQPQSIMKFKHGHRSSAQMTHNHIWQNWLIIHLHPLPPVKSCYVWAVFDLFLLHFNTRYSRSFCQESRQEQANKTFLKFFIQVNLFLHRISALICRLVWGNGKTVAGRTTWER